MKIIDLNEVRRRKLGVEKEIESIIEEKEEKSKNNSIVVREKMDFVMVDDVSNKVEKHQMTISHIKKYATIGAALVCVAGISLLGRNVLAEKSEVSEANLMEPNAIAEVLLNEAFSFQYEKTINSNGKDFIALYSLELHEGAVNDSTELDGKVVIEVDLGGMEVYLKSVYPSETTLGNNERTSLDKEALELFDKINSEGVDLEFLKEALGSHYAKSYESFVIEIVNN